MDLHVLLGVLQYIRVNHYGFVSKELRTFAVALSEVSSSEALQLVLLVSWQAVPKSLII